MQINGIGIVRSVGIRSVGIRSSPMGADLRIGRAPKSMADIQFMRMKSMAERQAQWKARQVPAPPPQESAYVSLAPPPQPAVSQPAPIPQVTTTQTAPITGAIATTAQQSANVMPVSSGGAVTLVPTGGGSDYMQMFEAAKAAETPQTKTEQEKQDTKKIETVGDNKNIVYVGAGLLALILLAKKGKRK